MPAHIAPHVSLVRGVVDFPVPSNRRPWHTRPQEQPVSRSEPLRRPATRAHASSGLPSNFTAPTVLSVKARSELSLSFAPTCVNGAITHAIPPCSDVGDGSILITAATLHVQPTLDTSRAPASDFAVRAADVSCGTDDSDAATVVTCSVRVPGRHVPVFDPLSVSVSLQYSTGEWGPAGVSPFPVINTAPVTPQTIAQQYG